MCDSAVVWWFLLSLRERCPSYVPPAILAAAEYDSKCRLREREGWRADQVVEGAAIQVSDDESCARNRVFSFR